MKAAWLERYSKAEPHLTVGEQPTPSVGAKDVLLRVSVDAALKKVAGGGSRGKTVLRV